jgi:transposase
LGVNVVEHEGGEVELVVERPAALVHKAHVTACVRGPDARGQREEHIAEFATTVRGLLGLRDWLAAYRVEQVVMEATGVYWKAPRAILEDDFECLLVNARHVKQVPGRISLRTSTSSTSRSTDSRTRSRSSCAPFASAVELLCTVVGIQSRGAECILAEIGADMSRFASARHLASWAGQCPGNDQSAGKRRSGKTRNGSKWLDFTLDEAAMAAIRVKANYPAAQYQRLKPRRGHMRALGAVKHSLICAIWHMLSTGETYRDLGPDYFVNRDPERRTKRLVKQLERLGHNVTLTEGAAAA